MLVAFLFNRKVVGADEKSLADALAGCNYAMVSPRSGFLCKAAGIACRQETAANWVQGNFASSGDPHQTILEVRARQQTGEDGI